MPGDITKTKRVFNNHIKEIRFSVIGVITLMIFLFTANLFLFGKYDEKKFEPVATLLIIIVLWAGCTIITYLADKRMSWQEHAIRKTIFISVSILFLNGLVIVFFDIFPAYIFQGKLDAFELRLNFIVSILICFGITSIGEAKSILWSWKESILKTDRLEKENIEAQFNVLKNQIDPHFLFNSLNTLASYVQNNPEANEYVRNLSEFLRHTLIRKEENIIPLSEELELLNQYVFLQKARFRGSLEVDIAIPDKITESGFIPPFALQMLVENAIKHNVISKSRPLVVRIYYSGDKYLLIENPIHVKQSQSSTKVGLANIIGRYRHLSNQDVSVNRSNDIFSIRLPVLNFQGEQL